MHLQILRVIILSDTAIFRELTEAKIHKFDQRDLNVRETAGKAVREKMEKIFIVKIVNETKARSYIFFACYSFRAKEQRRIFFRRRNRARLSRTGGCGFFLFFLSLNSRDSILLRWMYVGKLTSSRSLGLFRVYVGDQLFSYL